MLFNLVGAVVHAAPVLPNGAKAAPNINSPPAPAPVTPWSPNFNNAFAEAAQFGPGIWVNPGIGSMPDLYYEGLPPPASASITIHHTPVAPPVTLPFWNAISLVPYTPPLLGTLAYPYFMISPAGVAAPLPNAIQLRNQGSFALGHFSSASSYTKQAQGWANNYMQIISTELAEGLQPNINARGLNLALSLCANSAAPPAYCGPVANAANVFAGNAESFYEHTLTRNDQHFASYRALGLNPMWPFGMPNPSAAPTPNPAFYVPEQVSDYFLNITARFYYTESFKHLDVGQKRVDELGLLYQVFASMLSYDAATINSRYAPLDPSCRYPPTPGSPTTACHGVADPDPGYDRSSYFGAAGIYQEFPNFRTYIPPGSTLPKQYRYAIHFATPSELLIAYDVIRFVAADLGTAQTIASQLATGTYAAYTTALTAAVGKYGTGVPASYTDVFTLAKNLYNAAYTAWGNYAGTEVLPSSSMPRVSAALVAAAAMMGKKVDPYFWGQLAEAEQAMIKNFPATYKTAWVDKIWAETNIQDDFAFSLSDFAALRSPAAPVAPDNYITGVGSQSFASPVGLGNILKATSDATGPALVRGPAGLVSAQSEGLDMAPVLYEAAGGNLGGGALGSFILNQTPNAFVEVGSTGRNVVDGRIQFLTSGSYKTFEINWLVSNPSYLLPFETAVFNSFFRLGQVFNFPNYAANGGLPATVGKAALTSQGLAAGGAANTGLLTFATQYVTLKGDYQPLAISKTDSRYLQPALEFWLVTAEKLGNQGAGNIPAYNPPQVAAVKFTTLARANYNLLSANPGSVTVTATDGTPYPLNPNPPNPPTPPLANNIPIDHYQPVFDFGGRPDFVPFVAALNSTTQTVIQNPAQTSFPFLSSTNYYLYPYLTTAGATAPGVIAVGASVTVTGGPTGSGAGSYCQQMQAQLTHHDQAVVCP